MLNWFLAGCHVHGSSLESWAFHFHEERNNSYPHFFICRLFNSRRASAMSELHFLHEKTAQAKDPLPKMPAESESESELRYDWRFTAHQFVLATSPLRLTTSNFIFKLNTCSCSPYLTSSLTRGWVWRLQLLLILASTVILRSESRGTNEHILQAQIRAPPYWRARSPYLYPPGTGWPSYTPRHWVPFLSPPTTRRAAVEVFEPVSTRPCPQISRGVRYISFRKGRNSRHLALLALTTASVISD
jgi:hypothetical protein